MAVYVLLKIDEITRPLMVPLFGRSAPFAGIVLALLVVYLIGFLVTSLLGQFLMSKAEHLLARFPGARGIYNVWKEVFLNPPEQEGTSLHVVLIPDEEEQRQMIAFTPASRVSFIAMVIVRISFRHCGQKGSPIANLTLALMFALVILLIFDLDRPGEVGLIKVNQRPMIDLYQKLGSQK